MEVNKWGPGFSKYWQRLTPRIGQIGRKPSVWVEPQEIKTTQLACGWWLCPHYTYQFRPVCLAVRCPKPLAGLGPCLLWVMQEAELVWWSGFQLPLQLIWRHVTWTSLITCVCLGLWISCCHCQDLGTEEKAFGQLVQRPIDRKRCLLEGPLCLNWLGSWAWLSSPEVGMFFSDSKYFRLCGTYSLFWNDSPLPL